MRQHVAGKCLDQCGRHSESERFSGMRSGMCRAQPYFLFHFKPTVMAQFDDVQRPARAERKK